MHLPTHIQKALLVCVNQNQPHPNQDQNRVAISFQTPSQILQFKMAGPSVQSYAITDLIAQVINAL